MKFWRPGITGKLFIAILATCIVLLISMHWAVRISFERGFIDYIKRGNEQRLTMLGDALSEQDQLTAASFYDEQPYYSSGKPVRKNWRLKRGAMPLWYKQQHGIRRHVQSGAARVARFRPPVASKPRQH